MSSDPPCRLLPRSGAASFWDWTAPLPLPPPIPRPTHHHPSLPPPTCTLTTTHYTAHQPLQGP